MMCCDNFYHPEADGGISILDETLGIDWKIPTEHRDPSQGMTGEELHNFCKFLYSQIQSKDEEISRLTANIKELTDQTRTYRYKEKVGS